MAQPYVGEIKLFGFNFAPRNYALCNGQILAINQNAALFSLLGTTYGGNGVQNFALPDFRGRSAHHFGQGPGLSPESLGQTGGSESVTLTTQEIPAHIHPLYGTSATADRRPAPLRSFAADTAPQSDFYAPANSPGTAISPQSISAAGGSQPHLNMQPYLVMNFCIALTGVFPSRN